MRMCALPVTLHVFRGTAASDENLLFALHRPLPDSINVYRAIVSYDQDLIDPPQATYLSHSGSPFEVRLGRKVTRRPTDLTGEEG